MPSRCSWNLLTQCAETWSSCCGCHMANIMVGWPGHGSSRRGRYKQTVYTKGFGVCVTPHVHVWMKHNTKAVEAGIPQHLFAGFKQTWQRGYEWPKAGRQAGSRTSYWISAGSESGGRYSKQGITFRVNNFICLCCVFMVTNLWGTYATFYFGTEVVLWKKKHQTLKEWNGHRAAHQER